MSFAFDLLLAVALLWSSWRTLTTPGTRAVVSYGEPQPPEGRERRVWAAELHADVARLRIHHGL